MKQFYLKDLFETEISSNLLRLNGCNFLGINEYFPLPKFCNVKHIMAGYSLLDDLSSSINALQNIRKGLEIAMPSLENVHLASEVRLYAESNEVAFNVMKSLKHRNELLVNATSSDSEITIHLNSTVYVYSETVSHKITFHF